MSHSSQLKSSVHFCRLVAALLVVILLWGPTGALAAPLAQGGVYVVQAGDTLSSIAARLGVSAAELARANGITNPNFVYVGQRLVVPGGSTSSPGSQPAGGTHVVRTGETLAAIAARYGVSASALARANGLSNPNLIWVGQRLVIPGGSSPAPAPAPGSQPAPAPGVHVVQRGETLAGIALRYGTTVSALMAANRLSNPNFIWVGQRLTISKGGQSPSNPAPPAAPTAGRWIDINLSLQRLTAYQGQTPVFTTLISSGLPGTPTPVGRFSIRNKLTAQTMSGPGYWLPNVPYVMYFHAGYAIHGTYWHNNFGHPMSHGCVNVSTPAAAWLFSWAGVGTPVVVHR